MPYNKSTRLKTSIVWIGLSCLLLFLKDYSLASTMRVADDAGNEVILHESPQKVVSLIPSITEIIFALGAGESLQGITLHSHFSVDVHDKEIVGSFLAPCLEKIELLQPEIIFVSTLHNQICEDLASLDCKIITLKINSIEDSHKKIKLLGRIFGREDKAKAIIKDIKSKLQLIQKKTDKIAKAKRKRVMHLMGGDQVLTPGQDSFQHELIQLAGGITPQLGKKGNIVQVSKEEWKSFDPQVVYGCGQDRGNTYKILSQPGWGDVQAVQRGKIFWFPCDLTCRAATRTGDFVSWLSSRIYTEEFLQEDNLVLEEKIIDNCSLDVDLKYIQGTNLLTSHILDFRHKTLSVEFSHPLCVVSTLEGQRSKIQEIGNHFSPPPCWSLWHRKGLKGTRSHVYDVLGIDSKQASFLFTGADMDNLSIQKKTYKDMKVYALVTAGVKSNAMRMSKDTGNYYEPGTINIILLPNMKLTPRAMNRAIITATEAKTAALLDLDIRSAYNPLKYRATGTGTDNILVAEGSGPNLENAGGHSKLGELISKAVYAGVQEAVRKQNKIVSERSIFHRLQERGIDLYEVVSQIKISKGVSKDEILSTLYCTLLEPEHTSFLQSALALSDDYQKGLLTDLSSFRSWCLEISSDIAGQSVQDIQDCLKENNYPVILKMALNAILYGVKQQLQS